MKKLKVKQFSSINFYYSGRYFLNEKTKSMMKKKKIICKQIYIVNEIFPYKLYLSIDEFQIHSFIRVQMKENRRFWMADPYRGAYFSNSRYLCLFFFSLNWPIQIIKYPSRINLTTNKRNGLSSRHREFDGTRSLEFGKRNGQRTS